MRFRFQQLWFQLLCGSMQFWQFFDSLHFWNCKSAQNLIEPHKIVWESPMLSVCDSIWLYIECSNVGSYIILWWWWWCWLCFLSMLILTCVCALGFWYRVVVPNNRRMFNRVVKLGFWTIARKVLWNPQKLGDGFEYGIQ